MMEATTYTIFLTILFQSVPRSWFRKFKIAYFYLNAEFFLCFPFFLVKLMNLVHKEVGGDLVIGFLLLICFIHNRIGWLYLEDLIYADIKIFQLRLIPLNYFGFFWSVFGVYIAQFIFLGWELYFEFSEHPACEIMSNQIMKKECHPRLLGF